MESNREIETDRKHGWFASKLFFVAFLIIVAGFSLTVTICDQTNTTYHTDQMDMRP